MSAGVFERVAALEAQGAAIAKLMAAQNAMLAALTGQITALQTALQSPRALAMMPQPGPVQLAPALRSMMQIATDTAAENMLTVRQIRSTSRARHIAWPRQIAMAKMREQGLPLRAIADFWGMDHTSIAHGINAANGRESVRQAG